MIRKVPITHKLPQSSLQYLSDLPSDSDMLIAVIKITINKIIPSLISQVKKFKIACIKTKC